MFLPNQLHDHHKHLDPADAETLGLRAAKEVERYLTYQDNHPTPLHSLPALAAELGVGAIHIKDEGFRLGLGSFKALGGGDVTLTEYSCGAAQRGLVLHSPSR